MVPGILSAGLGPLAANMELYLWYLVIRFSQRFSGWFGLLASLDQQVFLRV